MKKGRRPTPTKLKLLRGNPGKRRLNRAEPRAKRLEKMPHCPRHLQGHARQAWRQQGETLLRSGILTELDLGAFALLCDAYGRWTDATDQLRETGLLVRDRRAASRSIRLPCWRTRLFGIIG